MGNKIGVIGGMGPMASQLFYKMITEKTDVNKDQDHIEMVIISDSTMPDRTTAIMKKDYNPVVKKLLEDCMFLEMAKCDAITITCNTAHFFIDKVEPYLNIPIINMIEETAEYVAKQGNVSKVAVLATDGTIKSELYQNALRKRNIEPYVVSKDKQKLVMYEIYERVKAGLPCDEAIWKEIEDEVFGVGCNMALLACTELSVIKSEINLDNRFIDPLEVLTDKTIGFSNHNIKKGKGDFFT